MTGVADEPQAVTGRAGDPRPVALVTGAASNIGRAIAIALARDHAVVLADLSDATALAKELGHHAVAVPGDVRSPDDCRAWVAAANRLGRLAVVVHSAGITAPPRPIEAIPLDEWERVIAVNLTGAFLVAQAAIPTLQANRAGSIVLISSRAGKTGFATLGVHAAATKAHYAASKAGVISLTKSLATELAPYGVRVNGIAPGPIEGTMLPADRLDDIRARVPLQRLGTPHDIADAACFLVSSAAAFITGHTLDVNGGTLMD